MRTLKNYIKDYTNRRKTLKADRNKFLGKWNCVYFKNIRIAFKEELAEIFNFFSCYFSFAAFYGVCQGELSESGLIYLIAVSLVFSIIGCSFKDIFNYQMYKKIKEMEEQTDQDDTSED